MGVFSNPRGPQIGSIHEGSPVANGSPSSPSSFKRKVSSLLPICVALVVLIEIGFLGRLDNAALVDTLTDFLTKSPSGSLSPIRPSDLKVGSGMERCEEWLEREDSDFESWSIDCAIGVSSDKKPDAAFGLGHQPGTLSIIRSMESSKYYQENDLAQARRRGHDIVMTTSLSSDVPVGLNKGECYGGCYRNRDGRVEKVEALWHYKFSLAFENTNEEDYVTEKFFQSLVAGLRESKRAIMALCCSAHRSLLGTDIEEFAPSPDSFLHIRQ
ncbi:hypothetical protein EUTSA_v10022257mg, partial [Eutrema salsugineum]